MSDCNLKDLIKKASDTHSEIKKINILDTSEKEFSILKRITKIQIELSESFIKNYITSLIRSDVNYGFIPLYSNHPYLEGNSIKPGAFFIDVTKLVKKYFVIKECNRFVKDELGKINIYDNSTSFKDSFYYPIKSNDILNLMDFLEDEGIYLLLYLNYSYTRGFTPNISNIIAIWFDELKDIINTNLKFDIAPVGYRTPGIKSETWDNIFSRRFQSKCSENCPTYNLDSYMNLNNAKKILKKAKPELEDYVNFINESTLNLENIEKVPTSSWGYTNVVCRSELVIPKVLYSAKMRY